MENVTYSVSELNTKIKKLFDSRLDFRDVLVSGELSNVKLNGSGHLYFSLKDAGGIIRSVMFFSSVAKLRFQLADGMKVIARGSVSVYTKDGSYQLYVTELFPDGQGTLYEAFENLKKKLFEEGLFDQAHKKELPRFPSRIAVITSPTGAAVQDIIRILGKRWPLAKVLVVPAKVQGEHAAEEISKGIRAVNAFGCADVIIIGRGGGSIEELWAFNEELLARTVYASGIPVVSAVGHETDFTITDFVADVRASTPSNAAELVTPDLAHYRVLLKQKEIRLANDALALLKYQNERVNSVLRKRVLSSPIECLHFYERLLDDASDSFFDSFDANIRRMKQRFIACAAKLEALNPLTVLLRGYGVVSDENGIILSTTESIRYDDKIKVKMCDGELDCKVLAIHKGALNNGSIEF